MKETDKWPQPLISKLSPTLTEKFKEAELSKNALFYV